MMVASLPRKTIRRGSWYQTIQPKPIDNHEDAHRKDRKKRPFLHFPYAVFNDHPPAGILSYHHSLSIQKVLQIGKRFCDWLPGRNQQAGLVLNFANVNFKQIKPHANRLPACRGKVLQSEERNKTLKKAIEHFIEFASKNCFRLTRKYIAIGHQKYSTAAAPQIHIGNGRNLLTGKKEMAYIRIGKDLIDHFGEDWTSQRGNILERGHAWQGSSRTASKACSYLPEARILRK